MSRFRKSFNDIYDKLWDILDKPKLTFQDRMRCKRLLNQLWREHHFGKFDRRPLKFSKKE